MPSLIQLFRCARDDEFRHPNRYWTKVELDATLVQVISAMVVLSLSAARDEHPQTSLLIWFIGYTCGCIAYMHVLCLRLHTLHQDRSYEEFIIQAVGDEYSRPRIHKVMEFFKVALEFFFIGWFLGYQWFFYNKSSSDDDSLLYWLSLGFLTFTFIRHLCIFVLLFYLCTLWPVYTCCHAVVGVIRFIIMVIKASYACFSRSNEEDIICCICLGKCGKEKEGPKGKLPCSHVFHFKCIRRWLRIKPTCPLCQSQIDVLPTLLSKL